MALKSRYNSHKQKSTYGPNGTFTTFDADKAGTSDEIVRKIHGDNIELHTNLDNIISPYHKKKVQPAPGKTAQNPRGAQERNSQSLHHM